MSIARVPARPYPRNGHAVGDADMEDMQAMNFPVIAAGETHDDVPDGVGDILVAQRRSARCEQVVARIPQSTDLQGNMAPSIHFVNPLIYKVIRLR